jgi:hypothetical protein
VSFMPWPLYPQGKSPWYPLDRRLSGPQNHSGHGSEEKNCQPLLDYPESCILFQCLQLGIIENKLFFIEEK